MSKHYQTIQKTALLGAIGGSLLLSLPAMAMPRMGQNWLQAQVNPHPSIFNEPPYNRSSSTSDTGSGGSPMMQPGSNMTMPDPSGGPNTPSSTSIENPNPPATAPSPYLQQQQTGGATQPGRRMHHRRPRSGNGSSSNGNGSSNNTPSSTSIENPNVPADNPSPYLQQEHPGDARQPNVPGQPQPGQPTR